MLKVLTWQSTREVDTRGYYILKKHAEIVFRLERVRDVSLQGFSEQNVIFGLTLEFGENGVVVEMEPCFGVSGRIEAEAVRLEVNPYAQ